MKMTNKASKPSSIGEIMGNLKRSEKTQQRIQEVRRELKSYAESVERLHGFAEGRLTLKGKGYTPEAESYQQTDEDKKRLCWTLNNLHTQIALLERELDVLMEYGA